MKYSKLSNLQSTLGSERIDLFLCCASFELRSVSIPLHLNADAIVRPIIFANRDYLSFAESNLSRIQGIFSNRALLYQLDTGDPLFSADCIVLALEQIVKDVNVRRVVVDVSTFTRESMLILLRYLYLQRRPGISFEFLYSNAAEYSVGDAGHKKWLSKGHKDIRSVIGFSGVLVPSKQSHLIVLVGFEDDRALALVHECGPSKISLGIASELEEIARPHYGINLDRLMRLKNIVGEVDEFEFSAHNAQVTKNVIHSIVEVNPSFNTIIAPMNTKISTIGAAMVALEDGTIQVCYSQADTYNVHSYSRPGEYFFHFRFDDFT